MDPWSGVDGGMPVGAVVPTGFEAYVRVFPAAYSLPDWERSSWSEVAASTGRVAHPLMEWHLISTPAPGSGLPAWSWHAGETLPRMPSDEEFRDLAGVLREFTETPDRCWFCIWTGFGGIEEHEAGEQVHHPFDRDYFLSFGPIDAVTSFEDGDEGPNIWWPDDRAWCVASEIDLATTYVGGSADCIARLRASMQLEVLPVSVNDRVDINADVINGD